jgi:K+-transporting ATPase c subunit
MRALLRRHDEGLTFVQGWKTGISIAVMYSILISLYFIFLLALVGPKLMQQKGETSYVKALVGAPIGFALFGTVFSAIIALVLKRKPGMSINEC